MSTLPSVRYAPPAAVVAVATVVVVAAAVVVISPTHAQLHSAKVGDPLTTVRYHELL